MSIPLDSLYDYIEKTANKVYGDVVIYRFWPHGSKNIENLVTSQYRPWIEEITRPHVVCNDQEPLNFDFYRGLVPKNDNWFKLLEQFDCLDKNVNLDIYSSIFNKKILLHSEKQSQDVEKYQNYNFIPVYYWSHALISLDWFRYAKHVEQNKKSIQTFLIYNRAWTGTREYRIKFADLLVDANLTKHCKTSFNPNDADNHYRQHVFQNSEWVPINDLEKHFEINNTTSAYSANFDLHDYENTDIEVVLETLFDQHKIHLTEKTLRPLACGQPFIMASTPGSLQYIKDYGFQTFDLIWDESYDQIVDPQQRLEKIISLMKTISAWDSKTREAKLQQARQIALQNKKHFFSQEFFDLIVNELENNLKTGLVELENTNNSSKFIANRIKMSKHLPLKNIITANVGNPSLEKLPTNHVRLSNYKTRSQVMKALQMARQYYVRSLNTQQK
jgi:hypothetical protein